VLTGTPSSAAGHSSTGLAHAASARGIGLGWCWWEVTRQCRAKTAGGCAVMAGGLAPLHQMHSGNWMGAVGLEKAGLEGWHWYHPSRGTGSQNQNLNLGIRPIGVTWQPTSDK
jgi:hypothetical protein